MSYPYICFESITDESCINNIYDDMSCNYYWSDDWSEDFYIELAYRGFISVAAVLYDDEYPFYPEDDDVADDKPIKHILLPEMQYSYAVLDWENLIVAGKVKKMYRSNEINKQGANIRVNEDFEAVLSGINEFHGADNWLCGTYADLMMGIRNNGGNHRGLMPVSVEIRDSDDVLAGGEIGYSIGSVYTSLSGFSRRERRYNNWGKIQLLCLAVILKEGGFDFWNLGHPYMQYKLDLGADILDRREFLARWCISRDRGNTGADIAGKYLCSELIGRALVL